MFTRLWTQEINEETKNWEVEPVFTYERHKLEITRSLGRKVQFYPTRQGLDKETGQETITLELEVNDILKR